MISQNLTQRQAFALDGAEIRKSSRLEFRKRRFGACCKEAKEAQEYWAGEQCAKQSLMDAGANTGCEYWR